MRAPGCVQHNNRPRLATPDPRPDARKRVSRVLALDLSVGFLDRNALDSTRSNIIEPSAEFLLPFRRKATFLFSFVNLVDEAFMKSHHVRNGQFADRLLKLFCRGAH